MDISSNTQPNPPYTAMVNEKKSNNILPFVIGLFVGSILTAGIITIASQQSALNTNKTKTEQSLSSIAETTEEVNFVKSSSKLSGQSSDSQKTNSNSVYKYSTFSLAYPLGWHFADIMRFVDNKLVQTTYMNPEPISIAPGDGIASAIVINIQNGITNPDEEWNKQVLEYKKMYPQLSELTTSSTNIVGYKFSGDIEGMGDGKFYNEQYLVKIIPSKGEANLPEGYKKLNTQLLNISANQNYFTEMKKVVDSITSTRLVE